MDTLKKNNTDLQPTELLPQGAVICCIIFGLSLYLWGCYEINYCVASKMKWWELGLSAVGMICPILTIYGMWSLVIGRLLFTDIEITYD